MYPPMTHLFESHSSDSRDMYVFGKTALICFAYASNSSTLRYRAKRWHVVAILGSLGQSAGRWTGATVSTARAS